MNRSQSRPGRPRVFVYEHVSGGGMAGQSLPDSWLHEGQAMLEAAVIAMADAGCDVLTTADARLDPNLPAETIRIDQPGLIDTILADVARRTDRGLLIAPETGGILHRLTKLADQAAGWNLGSSADAVALCGDKPATARHLQAQKLPHPRSGSKDSISPNSLFVVKPVDGAGSLDTWLVAGSKQGELFGRYGLDRSQFVVQQYVSGASAGLSVLCDGQGGAIAVSACLHNVRLEPIEPGIAKFTIDSGRPSPLPGDTAAAMRAVRFIPGLRGWVGVDVILDPAGDIATILEINPRLTSSFVWALNRTARSEIIAQWLALSEGERL